MASTISKVSMCIKMGAFWIQMATFSINMALMNLVDIMMTKIFTIHPNNYHKLKTVEIKIKVVRNSQIKNKMRGSTLL